MELNTHTSRKKQHIPIEDFDIEDIPFKPITDGLGFNDKKVEPVVSKKKVHAKMYDSIVPPSANTVEEKKSVPYELGAFYEAPVEPAKPKVNRDLSFKKTVVVEAALGKRAVSWIVDLVLIGLVFTVILGMMFATTQLDLNGFLSFLTSGVNILFPVLIFALVYNIFHIAIGFQSTPGQRALGLKNDFKEIKGDIFYFLLKRSLLELLAIISVGLPYLLKMDKNLLGNKVINK